MMIIRLFLVLFVCVSFSYPEESSNNYIDQYKELAVVEMYRSGIPASIKLAQGLLESDSGKSELAVNAKNHFGIKCKSYWTGASYYHKDDDRDHSGKIVDSCFRAYNDVVDSYVDHSNFLMFSGNYNTLFDYQKTDYQSWARGLKYCGYATDPSYAEKLIKKIEEHNLAQYDLWANPFEKLNNTVDLTKN
jgi:flagellum-specific peptidoglycan hydrolase FlgJ